MAYWAVLTTLLSLICLSSGMAIPEGSQLVTYTVSPNRESPKIEFPSDPVISTAELSNDTLSDKIVIAPTATAPENPKKGDEVKIFEKYSVLSVFNSSSFGSGADSLINYMASLRRLSPDDPKIKEEAARYTSPSTPSVIDILNYHREFLGKVTTSATAETAVESPETTTQSLAGPKAEDESAASVEPVKVPEPNAIQGSLETKTFLDVEKGSEDFSDAEGSSEVEVPEVSKSSKDNESSKEDSPKEEGSPEKEKHSEKGHALKVKGPSKEDHDLKIEESHKEEKHLTEEKPSKEEETSKGGETSKAEGSLKNKESSKEEEPSNKDKSLNEKESSKLDDSLKEKISSSIQKTSDVEKFSGIEGPSDVKKSLGVKESPDVKESPKVKESLKIETPLEVKGSLESSEIRNSPESVMPESSKSEDSSEVKEPTTTRESFEASVMISSKNKTWTVTVQDPSLENDLQTKSSNSSKTSSSKNESNSVFTTNSGALNSRQEVKFSKEVETIEVGVAVGVVIGVLAVVIAIGMFVTVILCRSRRGVNNNKNNPVVFFFKRRNVYATMEGNTGPSGPKHFRKPGPPVILPHEFDVYTKKQPLPTGDRVIVFENTSKSSSRSREGEASACSAESANTFARTQTNTSGSSSTAPSEQVTVL